MNLNNNMSNTKHLLKVTAAWVSIVYIVCYGGVMLVPGIRGWFIEYALHLDVSPLESVITIGTFVSGLILWNLVAFLGVWLFAVLFKSVKQ